MPVALLDFLEKLLLCDELSGLNLKQRLEMTLARLRRLDRLLEGVFELVQCLMGQFYFLS